MDVRGGDEASEKKPWMRDGGGVTKHLRKKPGRARGRCDEVSEKQSLGRARGVGTKHLRKKPGRARGRGDEASEKKPWTREGPGGRSI